MNNNIIGKTWPRRTALDRSLDRLLFEPIKIEHDPVAAITTQLARRFAERNEHIARWGMQVYMTTDWCGRQLWFRCQDQHRPGYVTAPLCKLVLRYRWPR